MKRTLLRLPGEVAGEIHWGSPKQVEYDGFSYVEEQWLHYDETRWTQVYEFVIKRLDPQGVTYWFALIEQGSTESQDTDDFRDEFIEFFQVIKVPTVTWQYHPILG